jgi:hypothetical protein
MKIDTIRNLVVLCGFALFMFSVFDVNFCLAEEWTRVGERCIKNCDDQPAKSQNTRGRTSQGQVKVQEQSKVQEQVTVRRTVEGQTSERQLPVKR